MPSTATVGVPLSDPLLAAMAAAQAGQKDAPDGPYTKAGPELAQLYAEYEQAAAAGSTATFHASNPYVHIQNGEVLVDAVATSSAADLAAAFTQLGAQVTGTYDSLVSAWLPIAQISAAAQLGSLHQANPSEMATAVGAVQSQGDKAMNADLGRAADHVDGAGVTVGVLSDSFNTSGNGSYATDVANGDLPPNVNVLEDESSAGTDEGRAMSQVVHDVAPGANLMFHTAFNGEADFASGITQLASSGANVITDDVIYYDEPFFQNGAIARAANSAVNTYGVSYFSCAFNDGTQSYENSFNGGNFYSDGFYSSASGAPHFFGGTAHNFSSNGYNDQQTFTLAKGANINLTFCWQQPNFSISGGNGCQVDMDIYILNSNNVVVAGDTAANIGGDALARVGFTNSTGSAQTYKVMLVDYSNSGNATPGLLKYINITDGNDTMQNLAFATNSSTSVGHSNAQNVQAVGAAYYGRTPRYGFSPALAESYSGASGCPLLFDVSGNSIYAIKDGTNNGLLVAPDGTNTSFFGGDSDGDGFPNFFGTSEAAPHAAAVAALMDQAIGFQPNPFYTYYWMEHTASDMASSGFDFGTGYGLLNAQAALAVVDSSVGSWTALHNPVPNGDAAGTMLLLSDGTVMAQGGGTTAAWYKLSPDGTGSYVNGSWTQLASMNSTRLYGATQVLPSGQVLYVGGEYSSAGSTTNTGEIYDPVANTWSAIAPFPNSHFGDDPSEMLPGGRVLTGYIFGPQTYIYDPSSNSWSQTGTKLNNDRSDEEGWVTLADGSILSYDIFNSVDHGQNTAQRYIPSTGQWVAAGTLPVALTSSALGYEMGPSLLLPDGRAFFIGANGHTALYTPGSNTWTQGPDIPNGQHADDAPGCVLANGMVLFAADGTGGASSTTAFAPPTNLYLYDPVSNSMTQVNNPTDLSGRPAFIDRMLALPNGQVLFTDGTGQLFVYSPPGAPAPAAQPTISSINSNGNGVFVLNGKNLNGFSEGASYGDDAEMSSNYPIIQLTDMAGNVLYARTFGWTSTSVDTGNTPVGVEFTLPSGATPHKYYLSVIANGIASAPVLAIFTASGNGTVKIDVNGLGGVRATLNGTTHDILPGDIAGIDVVNQGGNDTITVLATPAGVPLHIGGGGNDKVIVGNGSVQGIQGNVVIENYTSFTTITVDDSNDSAARTVTLGSVLIPDAAVGSFEPDTDLFGQISGLAPATISYEYYDTGSVTLKGGSGGNTWYVLATGDTFNGPTTNIVANGANVGIQDTVIVGNAGSMQDIRGTLNVEDPPSYVNLILDDSADSVSRFVSLSNIGANSADAQSDADPWGQVSGLSPAPINYEYYDLIGVTINGGSAGNVFTVNDTGPLAGTTTVNAGSGPNTINILATTSPLTVNTGNGPTNSVTTIGSLAPTAPGGSVQNILGTITLGGGGYNLITVDDSADTTARTAAVTSTSITGLAPAAINTGGLWNGLTIYGGSGGNTFTVGATNVATSLYSGLGNDTVTYQGSSFGNFVLFGQAGNDTVTLAGATNSLAGFNAPVYVGNAGGSTSLTLNDSGDTVHHTVTVNGGSITGYGTGGIFVQPGVSAVTIDGDNFADTFKVLATLAGVSTTISGGTGNDIINVGTTTTTTSVLSGIAGNLTVNGGLGTNTLNVRDSGTATNQTYTLGPSTLTGSDFAGTISFTITKLAITLGNGSDGVAVTSATLPTTTLTGGTGSNTLTGPNALTAWTINGVNKGKLGTKLTFSKFANLVGGSGVDTFKFTTAGTVNSLNGGGGGDWLDYASFTATAPVQVNLDSVAHNGINANSASHVQGGAAGAVLNIANVRGGAGADQLIGGGGNILVGGAGNDTLTDAYTGGLAAGGSLLIGGLGSDLITGGAAGDILIGGTTSYDTKNANLQDILNYWDTHTHSAAFTAIHASAGVGTTKSKLIWLSTVKDDSAAPDVLTGSAAVDWFFAGTGDNSASAQSGVDYLNNGLA